MAARQASRPMAEQKLAIPRHALVALAQPGQELDRGTRQLAEDRLGGDFGGIRVHTDETAGRSTSALGVPAYTIGSHIALGSEVVSPSRRRDHVLMHELGHATEQSKAGARYLQRYEAGEHAEFGEAGKELGTLVAERAFRYRVKAGELPAKIAARFGVTEAQLRAANKALLRRWRSSSGGWLEGFNAGAEITIPPVVNDATQQALKSNELSFVVGGVTISYGEGIALGDMYQDPAQLLAAPASELAALQKLIAKEKVGVPGTTVSAADWDAATGGRFHTLAEKNEEHFAPSNPALAAVSGKSAADHRQRWQTFHAQAIKLSQSGDKDRALATNALADHFLTDAFSAGHLINKRDVMELFKGNLPAAPGGGFGAASVTFFDSVASKAFVGAVKTEFATYETVTYEGGFFRPNIDSASRFSKLLQKIHEKEPDVLSNAVAKAVHDTLNQAPGGIPVENDRGDRWSLPGDATLRSDPKRHADTLRVARRAVAQSQLNVLDAFKLTGPVDLDAAYKRVWAYVPRPAGGATSTIGSAVTTGTDPKEPRLIDAVVKLISDNYRLILAELVRRGFLKKA